MSKSYFGVMLDCSRNGVMKPERVKRFVDIISSFGYNALQLYTEDTYQVENEPFFGYMRGGYTVEEIKDIDEYCKQKNVELIPCVQTLAHLNAIFKWEDYKKINDINDILLIDDERTYQLIENIFATLRKAFSSSLVNIGMDEAHAVGLGKYLERHGYKERFPLLKKHLNRVIEIAEKYGFKPTMWSDMFFKIVNGDYDFDTKNKTKTYNLIKQNLPEGVDLVYWNYYFDKDKNYTKMLKVHKQLNEDCWFAGGAWSWLGFAPHNSLAMSTLKPSMNACRKTGVDKILITVWGDDGQECSHFSVLPSLFYAIKIYKGETSLTKIKKEFKELTGEDFDHMVALELPNRLVKDNWRNPSKYGFYSDLLNGFNDRYTIDSAPEIYKRHTKRLKKYAKESKEFSYLYEMSYKLCDFMSVKFLLGKRLREYYKKGDRQGLEQILKDIKVAKKKLNAFYLAHYNRWMTDNNPHGFDVQDLRIGGLMQRLSTAERRVSDYLNGKLDKIEELETELLLTYKEVADSNLLCVGGWKNLATVNVI